MTPADYDQLQALVSLPFGACPSVAALRRNFPTVKTETWLSIYGQEQQYKVIRSHHLHKANVVNYLARYVNGEDVLQLSADVDFPPCMLLRRMLEKIIDAPKQVIGEVLRHPDRLDSTLCPGVPAPLLARLRVDVVRCVHADCCYSPLSDVAKQVTGLEYELYLQQRLVEAGLSFWSESELRQLGFHKTPDCKLKVPVAVRSRSGSEHLVCWVDSKATFGDHRTHLKQVEEQYCTYVNRYGPGMVIYWFGFVQDLNTDPQVLLCDDFPDSASIIKITDLDVQQQQPQQPSAGGRAAVASGNLASAATADGESDGNKNVTGNDSSIPRAPAPKATVVACAAAAAVGASSPGGTDVSGAAAIGLRGCVPAAACMGTSAPKQEEEVEVAAGEPEPIAVNDSAAAERTG
ncbi:hypothetical protein VaNZ11_013209 [Volvox africanus]|uniref:CDAN1-interacting nuclease 1 n=1 Tax=Volvox africanus TaxID=51714 RepID=A0ABQ5SGM1_9CHLO|nr:hypothetical protein VaNZ11_013209 [Volvox africanus]